MKSNKDLKNLKAAFLYLRRNFIDKKLFKKYESGKKHFSFFFLPD
jgi:hypothetical protein